MKVEVEVVTSLDRKNLVRRSVCRSEDGVIFFRSQKLEKETLKTSTVSSAFRPESIQVFVGLYLVHFHGSDTVTI